MKQIDFKEGTEADTLGRNGVFKTVGIVVNRLRHCIYLNPITSKRAMGRAWTEVPVEHAVEFAQAVLAEARHPEAMKTAAGPLKLTYRELSTILAALRLFQSEVDWNREMPHFDDCEPLDNAEIEALCERLNCDDSVEVTDGPDDNGNYVPHFCPGCQRLFTAEEAESYGFGEDDQPDTCPDCGVRLNIVEASDANEPVA